MFAKLVLLIALLFVLAGCDVFDTEVKMPDCAVTYNNDDASMYEIRSDQFCKYVDSGNYEPITLKVTWNHKNKPADGICSAVNAKDVVFHRGCFKTAPHNHKGFLK